MPTSAAAAARTTERIKTESSILARKRDSILSVISTKATKCDKNQAIAQCFGTSSRCERGTTVLEENRENWFKPRLVLKYTSLVLAIAALPFLIAPLAAITTQNGDRGIMTQLSGALLGLVSVVKSDGKTMNLTVV
jgi:hypothetical protein